MMYNK